MGTTLQRGFLLGNRRIDPERGVIEGPEGKGHVSQRAMDVLLLLAQRQGDVVGRDEIVEQLWAGSADGIDELDACIDELRLQLGDSEEDPHIIGTLPQRGYFLIPPVRLAESTDSTSNNDGSEHDSPVGDLIVELRRRRVFRVLGTYAILAWLIMQIADTVFEPLGIPPWAMTFVVWVAALGFPVVGIMAWALQVTERGVVLDRGSDETSPLVALPGRIFDAAIIVILSLIVAYLLYDRTMTESPPITIATEEGEIELPRLQPNVIEEKSIAVLPFENLGDDPRIDYLGMGLAEEVLNLLANIRELKVPSRTSSFFYHDKDLDLTEIAERLRVRNVLEGSIQGGFDDMRVSAQLIDSDDGYHIWSETFARRNTNLLEVRDDIANAVVDSLKVVLSVESRNKILERPTNSADAYEYYIQALSYLRRPRTDQTLDNAEGFFQRALDLDPEYARAYAGLCNIYLAKYRRDRITSHVDAAERWCGSALAFDPWLAEVHVALGSLYRHVGRLTQSELSFQRAIVLNPKLERAYYGLGMVYRSQDRLEEAEKIFQYAVDMEPGYWGTHYALGAYYLEYGEPAKAIPYFTRVTELYPVYAIGYNNLGAALYNSGQKAAGEEAYRKSLEIEPTRWALSNIGGVYYHSERYELAVEMFQQAIELTPNDFRNWGRLAFAQRLVPNFEDAARQSFQAAAELAADALAVNPEDWRTLAYLAAYQANLGEDALARESITDAIRLGPRDPHVHFFAAITFAALGDESSLLDHLGLAAEYGYSANVIATDPDFSVVRNSDRYKEIISVAESKHR